MGCKKLIISAVFFAVLVIFASGADALTFSPWIGYSQSGLKEINDYLAAVSNNFSAGGVNLHPYCNKRTIFGRVGYRHVQV